jgi:hypothetical protein
MCRRVRGRGEWKKKGSNEEKVIKNWRKEFFKEVT